MVKELQEFNDALRGLQDATQGLREQAYQTREAVKDVINDSHLRSTLRLLREDIDLKRALYPTY